MLGGFRRHKLVFNRDGIPAARVGFRRGSAFPLQAAFRHLAARSVKREAVKGPEKQDNHQQAYRDVNSTSHPAQGITRCWNSHEPVAEVVELALPDGSRFCRICGPGESGKEITHATCDDEVRLRIPIAKIPTMPNPTRKA
jgi:hypothetical protein